MSHPTSSPNQRTGKAEAWRPSPAREKSASFHGQLPTGSSPSPRHMGRHKTVPDLLAGRSTAESSPTVSALPTTRRVPSKVLVNVTVQRSLGAVHVMASTDWSVKDLVGATVRQYAKEGRRPLLSAIDPSDYGLHYSQFSLERIDPDEKLIGLGSRNFFMCPKPLKEEASNSTLPSSPPLRSPAARSCSNEAKKGAAKTGLLSWFTFTVGLL